MRQLTQSFIINGDSMKKKLLPLCTKHTDRATKLKGMLTHWIMRLDGNVEYIFQPAGLTEDGQPQKKMFLCAARLDVSSDISSSDYEEVEIPFEILGTQVTDKASGFTGMAIEFIRHTNGCFHVMVQPSGLTKDGKPIASVDFDLRLLEGDKVPRLTREERQESERKRPSPNGLPDRRLPV